MKVVIARTYEVDVDADTKQEAVQIATDYIDSDELNPSRSWERVRNMNTTDQVLSVE